MSKLPRVVQQFVAQQKTVPVKSLWEPKDHFFLYGAWWYRALACLLLSGRVAAKYGGSPNKTDLARVCKEGNFNEYLSAHVCEQLVAGHVLASTLRNDYEEGPNAPAFWRRDPEGLLVIGRDAVLTVAHGRTNDLEHLDPKAKELHTLDLLTMFFRCFKGKALPEQQVIDMLSTFCALPEQELAELAEGLGLSKSAVQVAGWQKWFGATKTPQALMSALYLAEWTYANEGKDEDVNLWWFASPTGLASLGLQHAGSVPKLSETLKVNSEGLVHAGAGLGPDKLVPLFRHCTFKKMAPILEFQVDRKRLAQEPADSAPGKELRHVLKDAGTVPKALEELLDTEPAQGGKLAVRWCSALIQPENATVLKTIRQHPQLKNYFATGAPPGYLMIKETANPDNFVLRCRALGFEVELLNGGLRIGGWVKKSEW